jgi:hypothetical protein
MRLSFPRFLKAAVFAAAIGGAALTAAPAIAFCGFYVAKADAALFNEASKVVMARDKDRTVITMVNDYQGDPADFAMVIPTPQILQREQINIAQNALIAHLDAYTAPRLVEYFDENPCEPRFDVLRAPSSAQRTAQADSAAREQAKSLGVTIEASYTVGEYDILILSAKQSDGLQTWLDQEGYKTPQTARKILASYIAQGMKFFVAKVNRAEQAKTGFAMLRPLQIAFESEKFMLPIRLGTVNAKAQQELLLFTLTRTGRVETVNYRTAKIPTDLDIPLFVQKEFGEFYKAMFRRQSEKEGAVVFTEYAWDMNWCDPCAADPLSIAQLRQLGAYWLPRSKANTRRIRPQPVDAYVTRLHLRYDAKTFPEDLRLKETGDRGNFQGRYVTRHAFQGEAHCAEMNAYRQRLRQRYEKEAKNLASLTGWPIDEIRNKMAASGQDADSLPESPPWWKTLWD